MVGDTGKSESTSDVVVVTGLAELGVSRAVLALTGDRRNALSSWRISLSHLTTRQELEIFLAAFDKSCPKE